MNSADEKAIRQGIEVAERQMAEIDARLAEIRTLSERRSALAAYIAHAKHVLGEVVTTEIQPATGHIQIGAIDAIHISGNEVIAIEAKGGPRPIWFDAMRVLAAERRPMVVPEIVERMKEAGRELVGPNITEVVRAALNRKQDVVENIGKGFYVIKSWPAELKKRPDV